MSDLPRMGSFKKVTSLTNPLVKDIRALHQKKHRDESGLFIAEGQKLVRDAVEGGWAIHILAYAATLAGDERIGALAARTKSAGGDGARSLGAGAGEDRAPRQSAERHRRLQAAVRIGFRRSAARASGWRSTGCAIPATSARSSAPPTRRASPAWRWSGPCVDPFGVEAVRATMGSIFHVPVAKIPEDALIAQARRAGARLLGTHLSRQRSTTGKPTTGRR